MTRRLSLYIALAVASAFLSLIAYFVAADLNTKYLENHAFYGDTQAYYYAQSRAYWRFKYDGQQEALKREKEANSRNPLRVIPLLKFCPRLLVDINGHIVTAAFMLFVFLWTFACAVYKRSGSTPYAFASLLLVFSWRHFFDPVLGLGGNFADLPAAFLVGAALFSLLNSERGTRLGWLFLFGIFIACAGLSRFVAAGYGAVICGPILAYYVVGRAFREKNGLAALIPLVVIFVPVYFLAGQYYLQFTPKILSFYSVSGYALGHPVSRVFEDFVRSFSTLSGVHALYFILAMGGFYLFRFRSYAKYWGSLLETLWAVAAHFILIVFVLKVYGDWLTLLYLIPGFMLLGAAPVALRKESLTEGSRQLGIRLSFLIGGALLLLALVRYPGVRSRYDSLDALEQRKRTFQREVTAELVEEAKEHYPDVLRNDLLRFDTFFFEYGPSIVNEAAFWHATALRWDHHYFQTHMGGWRMNHKGKTLEEVKNRVYERVLENVDYILILENPRSELAAPIMNNEWSPAIIEDMWQRFRANPADWKHEEIEPGRFTVESPWGPVHFYRNLKRRR
ncbi:hypothetical protein N9K06_01605 [Omnitrophica bacterium]|nr:hypothetical protein [Candidatus Omnitrophota bacterium]